MRVQVAGRHVDVGEALRSRIVAELDTHITKAFSRATDATVTVARGNVGYVVDCVVNLPSGISLQAEGAGSDAHRAFDAALDRIRKRTRRYKQRLSDHHAGATRIEAPVAPLVSFARAVETELDATDEAPLVIAEPGAQIPTLTVSEAVLRLDPQLRPALLFRNAAHGGLGMVYLRPDGNVGWVDPERTGALGAGALNGHTKHA